MTNDPQNIGYGVWLVIRYHGEPFGDEYMVFDLEDDARAFLEANRMWSDITFVRYGESFGGWDWRP